MSSMTRHVAAAALLVLLATGCVTQPVDPAALEQEQGVTVAPLSKAEAKRAARDARAAMREARTRPAQGDKKSGGAGRNPAGGAAASGDGGDAKGDGARGDGPTSAAGGSDGAGGGAGPAGARTRTAPTAGAGAGGSDAEGAAGGGASGGAAPSRPTMSALVEVIDAAGDPTGKPPAYADVRSVLVHSDGERVRFTVGFAGRVPAALNSGEVQGVGLDLYRSGGAESDYQLFADGGSDGWMAFLHTPQGIVTYPGSFRLGGKVMVFEVPWSALGGRKPARMGLFVDWSKERTVLNQVGNDRAPDDGTVAVQPG